MVCIVALDLHQHFVYHETMNASKITLGPEALLSEVAAAIGEPARTRMLCCLMDGHARTATELSVVAQVSASTASVHLARLKASHLVDAVAQGKHRYFRLAGPQVGAALEALMVLSNGAPQPFVPNTPSRLRDARTCYDHLAGTVAVAVHDQLLGKGWLVPADGLRPGGYELTKPGEDMLAELGVDVAATRAQRRRFACACMDWSERRPHLGGALGAAFLKQAIASGWVAADLDSRAVTLTSKGRRTLQRRLELADEAM